ncbi:hypothetical protein BGZ46_006354, partial [Entomortierella lignicola]
GKQVVINTPTAKSMSYSAIAAKGKGVVSGTPSSQQRPPAPPTGTGAQTLHSPPNSWQQAYSAMQQTIDELRNNFSSQARAWEAERKEMQNTLKALTETIKLFVQQQQQQHQYQRTSMQGGDNTQWMDEDEQEVGPSQHSSIFPSQNTTASYPLNGTLATEYTNSPFVANLPGLIQGTPDDAQDKRKRARGENSIISTSTADPSQEVRTLELQLAETTRKLEQQEFRLREAKLRATAAEEA